MSERKAPKLKLVQSTVWTCAGCGRWMERQPDYYDGDFGKGDYCEKCGCTSIEGRDGRPFGPKSKRWEHILREWEDEWEDILRWYPESVSIDDED